MMKVEAGADKIRRVSRRRCKIKEVHCSVLIYSLIVPAVEYLDKFELGMSNDNVSPVCLQRRLDGISKPIPVTNGFPLGDSVHNRAYVS